MEVFLLLIFWLVISILIAVWAKAKGYSGMLYFLGSFIFSPLLGFLIVLLSEDKTKPNAKTHKKCPECKELVLIDALKCKHCGSALVLQT